MVELRMIQHLHHRSNCAGLGIIRSVDQSFDARVHHRTRAHRTRFNCNKEVTVSQAMVTNVRTGFAQRDDLGVRRRIRAGNIAVPSAAHDCAIANDDRAYRDLSHFQRTLGAAQRLFHPEFVGAVVGRRSPVVRHLARIFYLGLLGEVGDFQRG